MSDIQMHKIGGDLNIPAKEAQSKDDPLQYIYQVQILEEPHDKSHEKGKAVQKEKGQWSGRLVDVQCNAMRHVDIIISEMCDLTIFFSQSRPPGLLQVHSPEVHPRLC